MGALTPGIDRRQERALPDPEAPGRGGLVTDPEDEDAAAPSAPLDPGRGAVEVADGPVGEAPSTED